MSKNIVKIKSATILPQKRKCLSAKKEKQIKHKNVSKVVLAKSSYSFKGQELTIAECISFQEKMKSYFLFEAPPVLKWSELKQYSKEERKAMRPKHSIPSRSCLALGFNEVSRALEQKLAKIVIISDNIKPDLLYKHICQHCTVHNIPLLRVRNFKKLSNMCFGFSSMMMAFKHVGKDEKVYEFYKSVKDLCRNECSVPSTSKTITDLDKSSEPEKMVVEKSEKNILEEPEKNVYVYRLKSDSRSFIPPAIIEPRKVFNANFIAFDNISQDITSSHTQLDTFMIKKIKGSNNRKRRGKQQN